MKRYGCFAMARPGLWQSPKRVRHGLVQWFRTRTAWSCSNLEWFWQEETDVKDCIYLRASSLPLDALPGAGEAELVVRDGRTLDEMRVLEPLLTQRALERSGRRCSRRCRFCRCVTSSATATWSTTFAWTHSRRTNMPAPGGPAATPARRTFKPTNTKGSQTTVRKSLNFQLFNFQQTFLSLKIFTRQNAGWPPGSWTVQLRPKTWYNSTKTKKQSYIMPWNNLTKNGAALAVLPTWKIQIVSSLVLLSFISFR